MKYAVIKTGGKQYRVWEGQTLEVEKLNTEPKKSFEFGEVFLVVDGDSVLVGQPHVPNAKVTAEVLAQVKGPKIRVAKFKAKVRYRLVRGHRQSLTRVKIEKIVVGEEKLKSAKKAIKRAPRKTAKTSAKKS